MLRKLLLVFVLTPSIAFAQDGHAARVRDNAEFAERTEIFGREMARLGFSGKIQACDLIMRVAVGVKGGNMSYGGICTIAAADRTQRVMMCDDNMVGHFGLKAFTFVASEDAVADFTRRNCYGG
jgi:hypothetical protein